METITVYVPSKDKMLNNRVYSYDRKDHQWYVETPVEKQEGVYVFTPDELHQFKLRLFAEFENDFNANQGSKEKPKFYMGEVRELINDYLKGDISIGRLLEILNEKIK